MLRNLFLLVPAASLLHSATPNLANLPLHFEPDPAGGFTAITGRVRAEVRNRGLRFHPPGKPPVTLRFQGAREDAAIEPLDRLPGVSNYYVGNDPRKWREKVPHYARVRVRNVYPGIDAVYHADGRDLEYDFVLAPGADPRRIQLGFEGADRVDTSREGDLVISANGFEIRQRRARIYQRTQGREVEIAGRYRSRDGAIGFELGNYDASQPLVIDPILSFGTYFGYAAERATAVAVDSAGSAVVAGDTLYETGVPLLNPADSVRGISSPEGIVFRLNATGTALVFSTYLGGSAAEHISAVALDAAGNTYAGGKTNSTDFPLKNPLQPTLAGGYDGVVAKFDPLGALMFSTYLGGGGDDVVNGLAVNATGLYAAGATESANFPGASGSRQGSDAFVTKLAVAGSPLSYTAILASAAQDEASAVAAGAAGAVWIAGVAGAALPATQGSLQPAFGGNSDAFVAKLNAAGSSWAYVTHLGGQGADRASGIALDAQGKAYVTGATASANFPVASPFDPLLGETGQQTHEDAFVSILNAAGTGLTFSTFLGGTGPDSAAAITLLADGSFAVAGYTESLDFPVKAAWKSTVEGRDAFIAKFTATGSLLYSTLFGNAQSNGNVGTGEEAAAGIAADGTGAVYVAGYSAFPRPGSAPAVTPGAFDTLVEGYTNALVGKFIDGLLPVDVTIASNPPGRPVIVDGRAFTTPVTLVWQPGTDHTLDANTPQLAGTSAHVFNNWSMGGGAKQKIAAPAAAATYTVTYDVFSCAHSVTLGQSTFNFEGGSGEATVNTNCPFTASSDVPWIVFQQSAYGSGGSYAVRYSVLPNVDAPRTGTLRIADRQFTVSQSMSTGSLPKPLTAPWINDGRQVQLVWQNFFGNPSVVNFDVRVVTAADTGTEPSRLVFAAYYPATITPNAVVNLPRGSYWLLIRACGSGPASDSNCGPPGKAFFPMAPQVPTGVTMSIGSPTPDQVLTASTNLFTWTPSQPIPQYPFPVPLNYDVTLLDAQRGTTELQLRTAPQGTVFTARSSNDYRLSVRACFHECADPTEVRFKMQLPPVPAVAPSGIVANVVNGNTLTVSWNPVPNADLYRVQVVQTGAGPGGGALTVAAQQLSTTSASMPVPSGPSVVIINACNGDGCGPQSNPVAINPSGPNPSVPVIATPMPGIVADGPVIFVSWNRIAGDNGSNTDYRLYIGDLSRDGPALDVVTKNNYFAAYLRAEGRRYDAFVIATQNGVNSQGPSAGFLVRGTSASAPLITAPTHNATARGLVRIAWSPIPGAARYQYYIARQGQPAGSPPVSTGMSPGLYVETALPLINGAATAYQAIVRACPDANQLRCRPESDDGWGPWSSSVTGTTSFTMVP